MSYVSRKIHATQCYRTILLLCVVIVTRPSYRLAAASSDFFRFRTHLSGIHSAPNEMTKSLADGRTDGRTGVAAVLTS